MEFAEQKGRVEGLSEGRAEGVAEGFEKGKAEERRSIALQLKRMGMFAADIGGVAGLSKSEIGGL